jgi:hypothetical protein
MRRNAPGAARKLAGALLGAPSPMTPAAPNSAPPAPPQSLPDASQPTTPDLPAAPPAGAADGLGSGTGGLAVHPSLKAAKINAYEPKHSSKHR